MKEIDSHISNSLHNIAKTIYNANLSQVGPGLLSGKTGISLFLFYYSEYTNNDIYKNKAKELIYDVFQSINNGYNFHTFCDGIAGFAWCMEHLAQNNFFDKREISFLDDLDNFIYKKMIQDIRNGDYDFLHGALGSGIYFLNRIESPLATLYIEELLKELENQCIRNSNGTVKWNSICDITSGSIGCDLGLSHGMPSIIIFLCNALVKKNNSEVVKKLIHGASYYILSERLNKDSSTPNFPNKIVPSFKPELGRRMGWCYGDLGIGLALFKAGVTLDDEYLKITALNLLTETTNYTNLIKENITNCGVCHGTSGVALIYNHLNNISNLEKFKMSMKYWLDKTINMITSIDQDEENDFGKLNLDNRLGNQLGILDGLSGIGLTYISCLSDHKYTWDQCLLIS